MTPVQRLIYQERQIQRAVRKGYNANELGLELRRKDVERRWQVRRFKRGMDIDSVQPQGFCTSLVRSEYMFQPMFPMVVQYLANNSLPGIDETTATGAMIKALNERE